MLTRELKCSAKTGGGTRIWRGDRHPLPPPLSYGLVARNYRPIWDSSSATRAYAL